MWLRRGLLLLLSAAASACSADAVSEPPLTLDTKGAFLAVEAEGGGYDLVRTLAILGSGNDDDAFFVVPYDVAPQSFEEARELAKDPALPTKTFAVLGRRYFASREWRAVWFRSVSSEEEAVFR